MLMLGDDYDEDDGAVEEKDNTLMWVIIGIVSAILVLGVCGPAAGLGASVCLGLSPLLLFGGCLGCSSCSMCLSTPTGFLPLLLLSGTPEGEFELTDLDAIQTLASGFKLSKSTDKAVLAPSSQAMAY